jgi:hypothetical protein
MDLAALSRVNSDNNVWTYEKSAVGIREIERKWRE